jgi:hypothetical protein
MSENQKSRPLPDFWRVGQKVKLQGSDGVFMVVEVTEPTNAANNTQMLHVAQDGKRTYFRVVSTMVELIEDVTLPNSVQISHFSESEFGSFIATPSTHALIPAYSEEYIMKRNAVKPLDWDVDMGDGNCKFEYIAKTVIGDYLVWGEDGWRAENADAPEAWYFEPEKYDCRTDEGREECIKACEDHYLNKIQSTLI